MSRWLLAFLGFGLCIRAFSISIHPGQKIALICFPADTIVAGGCNDSESRLKAAGYAVTRINIDSREGALMKIRDGLASAKLPSDAPILIHAHGILPLKIHSFVTKRTVTPQGDVIDESIPSERVLRVIRSVAKRNPMWVSSCHSGGLCLRGDQCLGTSCKETESSFAPGNSEVTLSAVVDLLTKPAEFAKADSNGDGKITSEELGRYFCGRFPKVVSEYYSTTYDPGAKEISGPNVFAELVAQAKKKHGDKAVLAKEVLVTFVHYTNDKGKETVEELVGCKSLREGETLAKKYVVGWPKKCDIVPINENEFVIRIGAKDCRLESKRRFVLQITLEGQSCLTSPYDPNEGQTPQPGTFHLRRDATPNGTDHNGL